METSAETTPICKRCDQPIEAMRSFAPIFEGMHWICFHLEFEHDTDPDLPCLDPSCPWRRVHALETHLRELGVDPDDLGEQLAVD